MHKTLLRMIAFGMLFLYSISLHSQIIISQYYEGSGTNKWIELTNMGSSAVNTASPQLKLGLWAVSGSAGNITFTGSPSQTLNLNITIPANGTVLIGNTGNGTEVPYLNGSSAAQNSNSVINFNGNDGIALLDAANNVIDRFGTGINAVDISYVRNTSVTNPSSTFVLSQWTNTSLANVQTALISSSAYLGFHISTLCTTPVSQPSTMVFTSVSNVSVTGSFTTTAAADEYLVLRSNSATLTQLPVDGTTYSTSDILGNAVVQYRGNLNTFTATGLTNGATYYFTVFAIKSTSCNGGPKYRTIAPLQQSVTTNTNCAEPLAQPTNLVFTNVTSNSISGSFTAVPSAEEYLVLRSNDNILTANPVNGVLYQTGDQLGNYTVVYRGPLNSFFDWGLDGNLTYFYKIFSAKTTACTGGIRYLLSLKPLRGYTTTNLTTYSIYQGNLHSHSELSDGTGTVSGNLAYADAATCMDFLGISDHNHTSAGMSLTNWLQGVAAAKTASTSSFCALYGMEWGTISGGGHVVVYGTDSLMGWENGQYQVFVPEDTYLGSGGLFETIANYNGRVFATLAHPNNADFNNLVDTYDASADAAIIGSAVENGPSTSTVVNYTDYPASMAYLTYFRNLLARGYHVGPTIDHDNHNVTHGHTAYSRTAVLAASVHKRHIMDALRNRRFYATQDCGALVNFKIGSAEMGSITTNISAPTLVINANTSSPVTSIKLFSGVPGSGSNATQLTSTTSSSLTYTHTGLANLSTRYYYVDITEADGKRIITAPIWYTRNDQLIELNPTVSERIPEAQTNMNELSVYPNPCSEFVVFEVQKREEETAEVLCYDMFGRKQQHLFFAEHEFRKQLDVHDQAPGLYTYMYISSDGRKVQGKFSIR